jgi:hypothetical protein
MIVSLLALAIQATVLWQTLPWHVAASKAATAPKQTLNSLDHRSRAQRAQHKRLRYHMRTHLDELHCHVIVAPLAG